MAKYKAKTKDCQLIIKTKLSLKEKLNVSQLDFLSTKYIRGLFKAKIIRKGTIEYSGPIGISLYERLKKPISKYDFLFIMEQIVDIVQKLNKNSLIVSSIIFNLKNVYINEVTKELQFIYLPLEQNQEQVNIIEFMESIIYSANPIQENDTEYISRFIYFMKELKAFDAEKIEKFIQREDRSIVSTIKCHNVGQSGFITDKRVDYYNHYHQNPNEYNKVPDEVETDILTNEIETDILTNEIETDILIDEEETGYLNNDYNETQTLILTNEEETGLLQESNPKYKYASLYRYLTREEITLNKPVFRIGKEKSYSDYFVSNNDKVSRSHADIITRGQRFFIRDLDSKNHTYINEKIIPVQQEVEIFHGDHLKLANEEFEFRT